MSRVQVVRDYRAYETADRGVRVHRLVEAGDEVVTYEATRTDGRRFRNTT
jgi:hypothetical protein